MSCPVPPQSEHCRVNARTMNVNPLNRLGRVAATTHSTMATDPSAILTARRCGGTGLPSGASANRRRNQQLLSSASRRRFAYAFMKTDVGITTIATGISGCVAVNAIDLSRRLSKPRRRRRVGFRRLEHQAAR